jgi:chain length determinant protein tyrosine kinase EpsG
MGYVARADLRAALAQQYGLPYAIPGSSEYGEELVCAYQPFSREAEDFRALRSRLSLNGFGAAWRTLAVISAGRGDGRSFICANLAVACAQLEGETLLIDANLRVPRLHAVFAAGRNGGLADYLAGKADAYGVKRCAELPRLGVLVAGPVPPNPQELLSGERFAALVANLAAQFDRVIIDTPAFGPVTDAQIIAARAQAALVVLRQHRTRMAEAAQLKQSCGASKANLIGAVFNVH